ncbi:MAG: YihY family inner membrane protein, partial [Burkholderiales bacterium]
VMNLLRNSVAYAVFVAGRIVRDRCLTVAGSLTFTTLLALVPLFTVTVTLTSRLPYTREVIQLTKNFILKNFVPDMASRMVGTYVDQFAANATRLTTIGLLIVIASAIMLLLTIENAFNDIWRAARKRRWWHRLRWAITLLAAGPLLLGASLSATLYLVRLSRIFERSMPWLDDSLLRALPWLMTTLLLYLAYRWIPNRWVPPRHALIGAALAAVLFELMKSGFVLYIAKVPTYNVVYGAFASVPVFLLWLFLCWLVVLLGAEIAATLSYLRHPGAQRGNADLVIESERLRAALAAADSPRTLEQLRMAAPMPIDHAEDALHTMLEAGEVEELRKPQRYRLRASAIQEG